MKTEITHLRPMLLGGVGFYGDPFRQKSGWDSENEIGKTCSRFIAHAAANPERPYSCNQQIMYEIHIYGEETEAKGYFEVFVGEEVNTAELPVSLCAKYLPESDYIKITLTGREIVGDWWQTLNADIMPGLGVKRRFPYIIQAYDDRFKGMDQIEASTLDAYVPVEAQ